MEPPGPSAGSQMAEIAALLHARMVFQRKSSSPTCIINLQQLLGDKMPGYVTHWANWTREKKRIHLEAFFLEERYRGTLREVLFDQRGGLTHIENLFSEPSSTTPGADVSASSGITRSSRRSRVVDAEGDSVSPRPKRGKANPTPSSGTSTGADEREGDMRGVMQGSIEREEVMPGDTDEIADIIVTRIMDLVAERTGGRSLYNSHFDAVLDAVQSRLSTKHRRREARTEKKVSGSKGEDTSSEDLYPYNFDKNTIFEALDLVNNVRTFLRDAQRWGTPTKMFHQMRYLLGVAAGGGSIGVNALMRLGLGKKKSTEAVDRRCLFDNLARKQEFIDDFEEAQSDDEKLDDGNVHDPLLEPHLAGMPLAVDDPDVAGVLQNSFNEFFEGTKRKPKVSRVDLSVIRAWTDDPELTKGVLREDTMGRSRLVPSPSGETATYRKPRVLQVSMNEFLEHFHLSNTYKAWQEASKRSVIRNVSGERMAIVVLPTISRTTFSRGMDPSIVFKEEQRDTADRLVREFELALEAMSAVRALYPYIWREVPNKLEEFLVWVYCDYIVVPGMGITSATTAAKFHAVQVASLVFYKKVIVLPKFLFYNLIYRTRRKTLRRMR